jgi:TfoX/Sxy family transcriptional regulator of competence genes
MLMKIPKPTQADRERFTGLVPEAPQVEVKPMFGNLGAFVNGNMFMGLFGSDVGIKLPEDDQQRLLAEPGAGPFGPQERPMAGYVTIPAGWPADTADDWIGKSLAYVAGLPPKKPKAAAKPAQVTRAHCGRRVATPEIAGAVGARLLTGDPVTEAGNIEWPR